MTATSAMYYSSVTPSAERARPEGLDRVILQLGISLMKWARTRADQKATARQNSALGSLSDHERAQLYREATALRESAYAERARWRAIG